MFLFSLQNALIDTHKRSSVRHKLVSLTLKKKSKITEEVSVRSTTARQILDTVQSTVLLDNGGHEQSYTVCCI